MTRATERDTDVEAVIGGKAQRRTDRDGAFGNHLAADLHSHLQRTARPGARHSSSRFRSSPFRRRTRRNMASRRSSNGLWSHHPLIDPLCSTYRPVGSDTTGIRRNGYDHLASGDHEREAISYSFIDASNPNAPTRSHRFPLFPQTMACRSQIGRAPSTGSTKIAVSRVIRIMISGVHGRRFMLKYSA
jgi:hypothetical protein